MSKYVLFIGYSTALLGTPYLAKLTELSEKIINIPAPVSGFELATETSEETDQLVAVFSHDKTHAAIRTGIELTEMYSDLQEGEHTVITIAKMVDSQPVDIWSIENPIITSMFSHDTHCEDTPCLGELTFGSPTVGYLWANFDKSTRTLNTLKAAITLSTANVSESDTVVFYELPGELTYTKVDAELFLQLKENPPKPNAALQAAFDKRSQKIIDSINAAKAKAEAEVTDPVQKSFWQRLREMVGN